MTFNANYAHPIPSNSSLEGMDIKLGDKVQDLASGFEGVVVAVTFYENELPILHLVGMGDPERQHAIPLCRLKVIQRAIVDPPLYSTGLRPGDAVRSTIIPGKLFQITSLTWKLGQQPTCNVIAPSTDTSTSYCVPPLTGISCSYFEIVKNPEWPFE